MALYDGGTQAAINAARARTTASAAPAGELVYQTWERMTGRPWSAASAGGFTTGTYAANIELQRRLLAGWNPYAPAPKPAPKPQAAYDPSVNWKVQPASPQYQGTAMQIEPGMWQAIEEERLELERQIAEELARLQQEQIDIDKRREEQERWAIEGQLAVSPIDFVAYELFRRELEGAGYTPKTGAAATDPDIQAMISQITGETGGAGYAGEFGTYIPTTQQWSREEFGDVSPNEMEIISSFLKAGLTPSGDGEEFSYDPQEYFREMEEGFVPYIQTPAQTRYQF